VFEIAAAFSLPVYIDMPEWDDWFRLMGRMSEHDLQRHSFDLDHLTNCLSFPVTANLGGSVEIAYAGAVPGISYATGTGICLGIGTYLSIGHQTSGEL
jgi:hypothetical protein